MTSRQQPSALPHLSRALSHSVSSTDNLNSHDSSDEDINSRIEVEFHPESRRRKASIVQSLMTLSDERKSSRVKSQCLVHSLVENTTLGSEKLSDDHADIGVPDVPGVESLEEHDGTNVGTPNGTGSDQDDIRATHSRLLTKKQLAEMALSVRTMAKKLGRIKVKLKICTIFLLTKAHDKTLIKHTREVVQWLLSPDRPVKYVVYVEETMKDNTIFDAKGLLDSAPSWADRLKYWNNDLARRRPHTFDFVVSLGGDGTVLYASWLFQRVVPPVLSFSLGSLGFLTKFDFNDYQNTLTQSFQEGVTISLRLRFEGTVMRANKEYAKKEDRDIVEEIVGDEAQDKRTHSPEQTFEILNDIVVDRGPNPTMSTIELFGDDDHLTTIQADGVCVATPTGSTAYNLAAGGSLCHPENPVILLTAICAHTLSFRPVILPDTLVLRMAIPYDARTGSWASFDGRERVELNPGDYVTVSASRYPFAHVMPPGRRSEDWINSISRTLQWNSRQKQKPFQEWDDENKKPAK